jgi:GGDEF domain-containing protein
VDRLTGLPNRRVLQERVNTTGGDRRLALLMLVLYRFRAVNDALGHALGDRLLVEVARRLDAVVPPHDLLVRLGGDEFAVLATRVLPTDPHRVLDTITRLDRMGVAISLVGAGGGAARRSGEAERRGGAARRSGEAERGRRSGERDRDGSGQRSEIDSLGSSSPADNVPELRRNRNP